MNTENNPETITCIMYIHNKPFLCFPEEMEIYDSIIFNLRLTKNKMSDRRFQIPEISENITFKFLGIREPLYEGVFKINCEME
jgi:hypothetical protein